MDAYFLTQERRYRALYDDVRRQNNVETFSMNTAGYARTRPYTQVLISTTLLAFYGAITVFVIVVALIVF